MKKRILITGCHGFIGRALWNHIKERQLPYDLIGISRRLDNPRQKIIRCNLLNQRKLFFTLSRLKPDFIFHLAGGRIPGEDKTFQANFLTTWALLKTIEKIPHYRPRIIIPGTAAEYGQADRGVTSVNENALVQPASWYGLVKLMQTHLSLMHAQRGLDIIVVRMFNILGAGVPPTLAIGKFALEIAMIEKGIKTPVLKTKNLGGKRDFLDVTDVCRALLSIAKEGQSGEIYNICSGRAYRIRESLQKLIDYSKVKNIRIKEDKKSSSESYDIIGSNLKIRKMIDWKPKVAIEQSLQDTLNYYRKIVK